MRVILLILMALSLFGDTLELNDKFSYCRLTTFFEYQATPLTTQFAELQKNRFKKSDKCNFGYLKAAIWSKTVVKNNSADDKKLYLTNTRAGMDELDVYIVADNNIQHFTLGDTKVQNLRPFISRDSSCSIILHGNESVEITIRHANFHGPVDTSWVLKSEKNFINDRFFDTLFWGIFVGIVTALIIYNLSIYFALKRIEFIYYVGVAISAFIFQIHTSGLMYALDIGMQLEAINNLGYITGIFGVLFGVLFNYYFLNIKTNFRRLHKVYIALIALCFIMLANLVLGGIYSDIMQPLETFNVVFGSATIVFISIIGAISAYKNTPGALYYTIGQSCMFLLHIYFIATIRGNGELPNNFFYKIPAIGTLLDVIFLALALNVRIKNDNILSRRNENLIFFLSRFDATGVVLNNIIHQWKLPLSRIGTLVTEIEALIHLNRPIEQKIKDGLPQISYNLELMKHTVKEFYEFYKNDDKKTLFYPKKEIDSIVSILGDEIKELDMSIKISIPTDISINTFRHAFVHIFLILLHNSAKIAKTRKIQKPSIVISSQSDKVGTIFYVQDNCGGIESNVYDKLFDLFVSTNQDQKTPNGSGLVIAKMLTEERLGGSLSASNGPNGAIFTVRIP